jgi:hypothetical protein
VIDLLTPKELGHELRRNARYVYAMRHAGFPMPGGTATLSEARLWLEVHPYPRRRVVIVATRSKIVIKLKPTL